MKPIWYFIGLILFSIGGIITAAGIYHLFVPPERQTIMGDLHPEIWWGAIMVITGVIFYIKNRNVTVE